MVYAITVRKVEEIRTKVEPKFVWKQFFLSLVLCLPFFTHGIETSTLTASAGTGHHDALELPPSAHQVPWTTTALLVSALISAPIYCFMGDQLGRRAGVYVATLTQGASLIPLFLSPSEANSMALHILAGVSSGGVFTVIPAYIQELSCSSRPELHLSLMTLATTAGFLTHLLWEEEVLLYLMTGAVTCQILLMFCLVESPSYLVKVAKTDRARSHVAKLTGSPEDGELVTTIVNNLLNESARARSGGSLNLYRILKSQVWRDAFKLGLIFNTALALGGAIVFLSRDRALAQLPAPLHPHPAMDTGCMLAGGVLCCAVICFVEIKYILTVFFTIMALSCGILAVYCQTDLTVTSLHTVPTVSLALLLFSYGVIWGLPMVVLTQMLNFEIRATLLGVVFAYAQILKLAQVHSFQYVAALMGIDGLLYVFAFVNLYGGVYALFTLPRVTRLSVKQIEKQLKKIPIIK